MKSLLTGILLFPVLIASAQKTIQPSSSEILLGLNKLNKVGSVLYIAAHPDDENTRLLAWLSKEKNLRTGYLSLTRGDGGQNLIGKEQADALGLIRTQELLAARRVDGAEQFFTRANDFGFSKNPEETFKIWNKDSILADVVWAIRRFKPDIIICRFPTTGEGGHGHHTASAILALEAFSAAADPSRFPYQLTSAEVWQAKRIFWNTFNFGTVNTTAPDQIKLDVGTFNPLLGKSYGEIAADSRTMHKSQGFGVPAQRGAQLEYFKFLKGDSTHQDLFENIDQSWSRLNNGQSIGKEIETCLQNYVPAQPEKSIASLSKIYQLLLQMDEQDAKLRYWKKIKLKECEDLILACSGLWLEAIASDYIGIPGNTLNITLQAVNRSKVPVKLSKISFLTGDTLTQLSMKENEFYSYRHRLSLPSTLPFSNPYWLEEPHTVGEYVIKDKSKIGRPENEPAVKISFELEINELHLKIERPLVYKLTDPVKGEIYRPLEILPPVTVNLSDKVYVFSDNKAKKVQFILKANKAEVNGILHIESNPGWTISKNDLPVKLAEKGEELILETEVSPVKSNETGVLKAYVIIDEKQYGKSIRRIDYDHIPAQFMLNDAQAKLVKVDLKKGGLSIGYIPGAGDDVPACLKQVGYEVTTLNDEQIRYTDLSRFDAIVTGVRLYNTNEKMPLYYNRLMEYVNKGGNLIVQYNTNSRLGPMNAKVGPYPFTVGRDRVTDENAEVRILKPLHPVLNMPNKISQEDFKGWVQERGIYFAAEVDKNYESPLSMNDPGEKPNEGSLIVGKYGKGNFVYTGLVFFRELPAGVPGAFRLFSNLLALPKSK